MGITPKLKLVLILTMVSSMVLSRPTEIKAGWFGEEAAMIISALSPILYEIVDGTKSIKEAMKFDELLEQYEEMEKLQKDLNGEVDEVRKLADQELEKTKQILGEMQKTVEVGKDVYQFVTDESYRNNKISEALSQDENGKVDRRIQEIYKLLLANKVPSINDLDYLYGFYMLDDEQQYILRLKRLGLSDERIKKLVNRQREINGKKSKIAEKEKNKLLVKRNLEYAKSELSSLQILEMEDLSDKDKREYTNKIEQMYKSEMDYERDLIELSTSIDQSVEEVKELELVQEELTILLTYLEELDSIQDEYTQKGLLLDKDEATQARLKWYKFESYVGRWL